MAISRSQLLKELLPGLNALFGMEYARYGEEHKEIYETESSDRSFEEETKLSGFSAAPVKAEGSAISYDNAQEAWSTRYRLEKRLIQSDRISVNRFHIFRNKINF